MIAGDYVYDDSDPSLRAEGEAIQGITVTLYYFTKIAAERLGVTRQALHRVLAGKAAMSPEMALRVGKFCGNGPEVWLRMQGAYDLWHAQRKLAKEIAAIGTARDHA